MGVLAQMTGKKQDEKPRLLTKRGLFAGIFAGMTPIDLAVRGLEWHIDKIGKSPARDLMIQAVSVAERRLAELGGDPTALGDDLGELEDWMEKGISHELYFEVEGHQADVNELCGMFAVSLQTTITSVTSEAARVLKSATDMGLAQTGCSHWQKRNEWMTLQAKVMEDPARIASELDHVANFVKHRDQWGLSSTAPTKAEAATQRAANRLGLLGTDGSPVAWSNIRAVKTLSDKDLVSDALIDLQQRCRDWADLLLDIIESDQSKNKEALDAARANVKPEDDS